VVTTIIWSAGARADLAEIYEFIARDSPRYAETVTRSLLEAPARLREFPLSGRVVPELQREDVREVLWQAYRIVYLSRSEDVAIVTVFRASRLFPVLRLEEKV
jgi:toxin ParE1/3/4